MLLIFQNILLIYIVCYTDNTYLSKYKKELTFFMML